MQNQLLEYFNKNNLTPRSSQVNCLNWINENLNDSKYFILQLPTGVGKTHIGLSLSQLNKKNLYVSSTNQLLSQYVSTDINLVEMKGMQQYTCNVDSSLNCYMAPCKANSKIKEQCMIQHSCDYYNQRDKFIGSKMGLTNYAFAVASAGCGIFSEGFSESNGLSMPRYDYIICDEAHNLENHLVGFATVNIDLEELMYKNVISDQYITFKDLDTDDSWSGVIDICTNIFNDLDNKLKYLENKILMLNSSKKSSKNELKKLYNEYYFLDRIKFPISILIDHPEQDKWVYEADTEKNKFKITPLNVDFVFKKYLSKLAKKFIFMSATIGDPNVFIKSIGLPAKECKYYECDSPFESKKSPIVILERLDMSYGNIDTELSKCLQYVEAICKKHSNKSGIIHSGNYKIAKYIFENCSQELRDRLVYKTKYNVSNNTELIKIHENNVAEGLNSVLLSPSLIEGVDLKDDLSRWQIIVKLPFSSLGDKRVMHLANIFPTWYINDVIKKIIQACGRSTRHENDTSVTYILDKVTRYTFSKIKLPIWFKNRIIIK